MNPSTNAAQFLDLWTEVCTTQHAILYRDWPHAPAFTANIFTGPTSVIEVVAARLALRDYCGYYSIDAILFAEQDLVPGIPAGQTWVRRIRIAFEHENFFTSGLFQELSHLLITDSDLRVLVSYPGNVDELNSELQYLHSIVAGSDRAGDIGAAHSLLFIVGWRDKTKGTIEWWGYVYEQPAWRRL